MKRIEEYIEVNGNDYRLVKRTEKVALFSDNDGRRYEVTRVYVLPKAYNPYWLSHFPEREAISANGQFNKDGSRFFNKKEDALWYFEKLNRELENYSGDNINIKQI